MIWRGAFLVTVVGLASLFFTFHVSTTPPAAPDYGDGGSWLCRPGRDDACSKPTTATIIEKNTAAKVETYTPDPVAPIDCFYLYPTVSHVHAAYSPIEITSYERDIVRQQFARFTTTCRPFAPLYRQVTIAGLPGLFRGEKFVNLQAPYEDLLAAWKNYLAKDNDGRAFVLIGHSQGARLLAKLLAEEIDGKPIQKRLVAAILPGTIVDVPPGRNVGSSFEHVPLCGDSAPTGCVIAYSSFLANEPIPSDARFGIADVSGMEDACVNPAALAGTATLAAELPLTPELKEKFNTDFVALPGVISAKCKTIDRFNILTVDVGSDDLLGKKASAFIKSVGHFGARAGLHALDLNLALGTLVDLVHDKAKSFARH